MRRIRALVRRARLRAEARLLMRHIQSARGVPVDWLRSGGIVHKSKGVSPLVGERGCVLVLPLSPIGAEALAKAIAEAQRRRLPP
jgi:hypothetical protein